MACISTHQRLTFWRHLRPVSRIVLASVGSPVVAEQYDGGIGIGQATGMCAMPRLASVRWSVQTSILLMQTWRTIYMQIFYENFRGLHQAETYQMGHMRVMMLLMEDENSGA